MGRTISCLSDIIFYLRWGGFLNYFSFSFSYIIIFATMTFYIDTSVWGGNFDKEFKEWTTPFFEQLQKGRFTAVLSNITFDEILSGPAYVRELVESIPEPYLEFVTLTKDQLELANAYIKEGALTKKFFSDAQHIAIATTIKVDSLVSWNFKHMVNFFRIRQYNSINLKYGYSTIDIRTPKEINYEGHIRKV